MPTLLLFIVATKLITGTLFAEDIPEGEICVPKKASVELMRSYFDVDNLPTEFGGKATVKYDHEDFSRLMAQDGVKAAKLWGFD